MTQKRTIGITLGRGTVASVLLFCLLTLPPLAQATPPDRYTIANLKALEEAFVSLAEDVRPSVVAVRTYTFVNRVRRDGSRIKIPQTSSSSKGSGFVLSQDGMIATNWHVVEEADQIRVVFANGVSHEATLIRADRRSDLAVIKIEATDLHPVRWASFPDVKVNQWAFAAGNPYGLANRDGRPSMTLGIVSALGRILTDRLRANSDLHYYGNLIETSASISPGSSGGPLFNLEGEVIGIVAAVEAGQGITEGHGFAIPADKNTRRIFDTLSAGKAFPYGFMGVKVTDVVPPRSSRVRRTHANRGAEIDSITSRNGPAARAGLEQHDIVIEFNGVSIENMDHLVRLVGFTPPRTRAAVTFLRGNVRRTTTVVLADRYATNNPTEPDADAPARDAKPEDR